eukprot:COSAG02_NODE_5307_length_4450_cov_7.677545_2_plen_81_part_00
MKVERTVKAARGTLREPRVGLWLALLGASRQQRCLRSLLHPIHRRRSKLDVQQATSVRDWDGTMKDRVKMNRHCVITRPI